MTRGQIAHFWTKYIHNVSLRSGLEQRCPQLSRTIWGSCPCTKGSESDHQASYPLSSSWAPTQRVVLIHVCIGNFSETENISGKRPIPMQPLPFCVFAVRIHCENLGSQVFDIHLEFSWLKCFETYANQTWPYWKVCSTEKYDSLKQ